MERMAPRFKTDKVRLSKAAIKRVLLTRSQGRCEARGFSSLCTGYGSMAHHIVRRGQGGDDNPENLLWVDVFCHQRIHDNPGEALLAGLLQPGHER